MSGPDRDTADRLAAAKLWLVSTQSPTSCGGMPYLATALYALVAVPSGRVRAMTVDRRWRLYVNPAWVAATDVPVIAAELAHLVWHLLSDHAARADDVGVDRASAEQWRTAADVTVGELLDGGDLATGLPGPMGLGLTPGRSAEEHFARLSRLPPPRPRDDGEGDRDRDGDGDQSGPGDGSDEPEVDTTCGSGCDGQPRGHELPAGDGIGAVGDADADHIRRRVAIEFREHMTAIGREPGQWSRWVEQVLDPVVPWTQVLAAAVRRGIGWAHGHTDYTYTRISRRQSVAGPVILPATRRPVPEVAVVVDTSGSVDDGLLAQALGEVDGVLAGLGVSDRSVTVLATDAAVHAVTRARSAADVRLGGGGGTDMGVGIEAALALRPRPTLVVVLTDGWTPWPHLPPALPVVAVIIGRHRGELPPTPEWAQRVECVPP